MALLLSNLKTCDIKFDVISPYQDAYPVTTSTTPVDAQAPASGNAPAPDITDVVGREAPISKPPHPAIELLSRYKSIFKAAWAHQAELAGPTRLVDEVAFLPAALSLQDTPVHPAPRRLAFAIMALFVIALGWATFGQIDIVAIAPGRVVVSERTKPIQPLERSVVKRVLVKDGDHVQAGQPLIELDPTAANADKTTAQDQLNSALSEVLRTRAIQGALQTALQKKELLTSVSIGLQPYLAGKFPPEWSNSEVTAANSQLQGEWADRSGSANPHSAISGNSGHDAGLEAVWREGVFDGQEIGAAHPPHPQPGIQGTRSAGGAA